MNCSIKNLPFELSDLVGLSGHLVTSHHQKNYAGAVKRLNAIRSMLSARSSSDFQGFEWNGLKREELIASNSITLHELYFESLGGKGEQMTPAAELAISASFGSLENWRAEFMAMGTALSGGSGWVVLAFQPREGRLINQWASDHTHSLVGSVPLLALDMYEHAYHIDYGADASKYIEVFMQNIKWKAVYARYQHAINVASEPFAAEQSQTEGALILDVRREGVFKVAPTRIASAQWRDPSKVDLWASELVTYRKVVVYCVYGHEVSRSIALRLQSAGVDAAFLRGGVDAWPATGLVPNDEKMGDQYQQ